MGHPTGFRDYARRPVPYRDAMQRLLDYEEIFTPPELAVLQQQGARCMDCGVPFCQSDYGCPIDNRIPEWNDLVYSGRWREALTRLHETNNFPEFTGRTCPAPCEGACVLGITDPPVTIKNIENAIIDRGFAEGWVQPQPPSHRTGKRVAIIGSGPCGLAAADQLNRSGHQVDVFERADRIGGLLTYGIPNMKLDKTIVQRRVDLLRKAGVQFHPSTCIGRKTDVPPGHLERILEERGVSTRYIDIAVLQREFDAIVLAIGATKPRDLPIPGRHAEGIHFAMEFLARTTMSLLSGRAPNLDSLTAKDHDVIVIGGGDTGTDCISTALRHGCRSLVNFELLDRPPDQRATSNPWPTWPKVFRVDYGHQEHAARFGRDPREFAVLAKEFLVNEQGHVAGIGTVRIDWSQPNDNAPFTEIDGSDANWPANLVLLAMGFTGPEPTLLQQLGARCDVRSNVATAAGSYTTNIPGVFAAGDCRRGQSLVVWAIHEGRSVATAVDRYLQNSSPTT